MSGFVPPFEEDHPFKELFQQLRNDCNDCRDGTSEKEEVSTTEEEGSVGPQLASSQLRKVKKKSRKQKKNQIKQIQGVSCQRAD